MSRPNPTALAAVLFAVLVALGGVALLKGGFYIAKHEGDTLHLIDIVLRMAEGQVPHQDFMTPIGGLAFAPIAFFVQQGMGIGMAILAAQVAFGLALLPAIWWLTSGRLSNGLGLLMGGSVLVLVLALVHGEAQDSLSISMHYNRWAWALAFLAIFAAAVPPQFRKSAIMDGIMIGTLMAGLVMIKVTYFAAFMVPVALGLLMTGQWRTFVAALVSGGVVAGILTAWLGVAYWEAYLTDLMTVANSEGRAAPGLPLSSVIGAPGYIGGSIIALFGVIVLRQTKNQSGGLVLLLLIPGFFYVTYQNFGNDPQWLLLLGVLLLALRPAAGTTQSMGNDGRQTLSVLGAIALAFATPSFVNMAMSPFRHHSINPEKYVSILPEASGHSDFYGVSARLDATVASVPLGTFDPMFRNEPTEDEDPVVWMGETLADCSVDMGISGYFREVTADMIANGVAPGSRVFAADIFNAHWLFADLEPLMYGAPWYYGGLPGYDSADYVVIPLCAMSEGVRAQTIKAITERGTDNLTEVARTASYILYKKGA